MMQSSSDDRLFAGEVDAKQITPLSGISMVRAHVDFAFKSTRGDLVLVGWIFDPEEQVSGISVLLNKEWLRTNKMFMQRSLEHGRDHVQCVRVMRPDVSSAMQGVGQARSDSHGLVLVVPDYPDEGRLALALADGRFAVLQFQLLADPDKIEEAIKSCQPHSGAALSIAMEKTLGSESPLAQMAAALAPPERPASAGIDAVRPASSAGQKATLGFNIEAAMFVHQHLFLIGWASAGNIGSHQLHILDESGRKIVIRLLDGVGGVRLVRTFRPDLRSVLFGEAFGDGMRGFVLHGKLDDFPGDTIAVAFDGVPQVQQGIRVCATESGAASVLMPLWIHAGAALKAMAAALTDGAAFAAVLEDIEAERISRAGGLLASCDAALLLNGRTMILYGWIMKRTTELERIELVAGNVRREIISQIRRYPRPDLVMDHPRSRAEAVGFVAVVDDPGLQRSGITVRISSRSGEVQVLRPEVQAADWAQLGEILKPHGSLLPPLLGLLAGATGLEDDVRQLEKRISWLWRVNFQDRHRTLPTMVDNAETVLASVDWSYPLGEVGVLIMGWQIFPKRKPTSIRLRGANGGSVDISDRMASIVRMDVVQGYRQRFPNMSDWCGFICLAQLPVQPSEQCVLSFDFGELGEVWVKVPDMMNEKNDREMIKDILQRIPGADKLRSTMFDVFSKGLGSAIEAISRRSPFGGKVQERQFGSAPDNPNVSVIVPLYGRFDFLRHQLAHFCDDPDFDNVDLIYVVDDPGIISQTMDLAARCHQLFAKPFRVVHYQQNLGFSGANNAGVRLAQADTVLLLNSDIIPQQVGWLSTLRHALETLPQAGAVGPLLQFGDNSVQHAGMRPTRDALFPGFLLNSHPGKGQAWYGPDVPSEQPLLTAAALMMRKQDYLDVGGLDEGYVIGDFEDSDLCLALRKAGKRLWLVPEAKLWHLERQSQNLEGMAGYRQLLTLYNGWRYQQKIRSGQIADPNRVEG